MSDLLIHFFYYQAGLNSLILWSQQILAHLRARLSVNNLKSTLFIIQSFRRLGKLWTMKVESYIINAFASLKKKKKIFSHYYNCIKKSDQYSHTVYSKHLVCSSDGTQTYGFGTTWGRMNVGRCNFTLTNPLTQSINCTHRLLI